MRLKLDDQGRITLPKSWLNPLEIEENSEVAIALFTNEIVIRKPIDSCVFCNSVANLVRADDRFVCRTCIERLHEARDGGAIYVTKMD